MPWTSRRERAAPSLDHVDRYESGVAVLAVLGYWPLRVRETHCAKFVAGLSRFTESYSESRKALYETHKVLMTERIIACIVDRSDAPQSPARGLTGNAPP